MAQPQPTSPQDQKTSKFLTISGVSANPSSFSPSHGETTTISYTLSEAASNNVVTIRIYDSDFNLVRTVSDASGNSGPNSWVWDGKDDNGNIVDGGSYFYVIGAFDARDAEEKAHRNKPALEKGGTVEVLPRWTVMVYLNADNDLEEYGIDDINEMETVGSDKNVKIVVQIDRIPGYDSSNGDWTDTRRYYITQDADPNVINSTRVDDPPLGELDMGDSTNLSDFATWAIQNYKAARYLLVIWDHGLGWKGVSFDRTSGTHIDMSGLENALNTIKTANDNNPIDIIEFDACLMAMVEVMYQIRNDGVVMTASEKTEPLDGLPYDEILSWLHNNSLATPEQLATQIVNLYVGSYSGGSQGNDCVTKSAVRLGNISEVSTSTDTYADQLIANYDTYETQIGESRDEVQKFDEYSGPPVYKNFEYCDLYHHAQLINQKVNHADIQAAAQDVMNKINLAIVDEGHHSTGNDPNNPAPGGVLEYVENAHGISIYYPPEGEYNGSYDNLSFSVDTDWDAFIQKLNEPPTSSVNPLPDPAPGPSFTVTWSGEDNPGGSGIKWYDVQYKDGAGGAWTDWLTQTVQTSETFNGTSGHTYYFQCRAQDNAGNWEAYPGGDGDTHTTVP